MSRSRIARLLGALGVAALVWLFLWPAQFGGYMTYVVVSGQSMEPTYYTGDLVVARAKPAYEVGDVVVFTTPDGKVVHRIVDGDGQAGFVMLGDNNDDIDQWTPTNDDIDGEAILRVPSAGTAVFVLKHVLTTPPFPYLLAGFVFLLIVLGDDSTKRSAKGSQAVGETAEPDSADISDEKAAV